MDKLLLAGFLIFMCLIFPAIISKFFEIRLKEPIPDYLADCNHCWYHNKNVSPGWHDNPHSGWYCETCLHCTKGRAVCITDCPEPGFCEKRAKERGWGMFDFGQRWRNIS